MRATSNNRRQGRRALPVAARRGGVRAVVAPPPLKAGQRCAAPSAATASRRRHAGSCGRIATCSATTATRKPPKRQAPETLLARPDSDGNGRVGAQQAEPTKGAQ
jgi:hypothetical protein